MHRILGTQYTLHKMGLSDTKSCLLCNSQSEETLMHLFFACPKSQQLWDQLQMKVESTTGFLIRFNPEDVLLGYAHKNPNSAAINMLIMASKSYIYSNSRKGSDININGLLIHIKSIFEKQRLLAIFESKSVEFEEKWQQMKCLF